METTPSPATISVIVPVYNAEKTLGKCVESICNSTYPYLEIICVNDGSSDCSADILAELAAHDPRIVVINQENRGVSAARNAALDAASGEYVTGVDSDDYIDADLYEKAAACFTPEIDAVSFGITEEYDVPAARPCRKMYPLDPYAGAVEVSEQVLLNMQSLFVTKLWRRSLIEEHHVRFPLGVRFEDADFFWKAAVLCRNFYFLRNEGYHYWQHEDSFMGQQFSGHANLELMLDMERRLCAYYRENGLWEKWKPLLIHALVKHCASTKHYFPPAEHAAVQRAYHNLALELGLPRELPGDFALSTLKPATGWRRLFFTNLPNTRVYRFLRIPLFYRSYREGEVVTGTFSLFRKLLSKLRRR